MHGRSCVQGSEWRVPQVALLHTWVGEDQCRVNPLKRYYLSHTHWALVVVVIIVILLSSSSSSSFSPLCRVSIYIFPRQTMSIGDTLLQLVFVVYGASMSSSCVGSFVLYVITFRSMCAVPNMSVFCSSLTSWFPGMSLTYFLNDLEMVPSRSNYYWYHNCFYIAHAL